MCIKARVINQCPQNLITISQVLFDQFIAFIDFIHFSDIQFKDHHFLGMGCIALQLLSAGTFMISHSGINFETNLIELFSQSVTQSFLTTFLYQAIKKLMG